MEWRTDLESVKDGQFYFFDSAKWPHPRVLRWAKVRLSRTRAFVSEWGVAPTWLPQAWQPLPARFDAPQTTPVARATVAYGGDTLRVVVVQDTMGSLSAFVAQALERDIAAQGVSIKEALDRLASTAEFDHATSVEVGREIEPAPPHVHDWYRRAPSKQAAAVAGEEQVRG